MASNQSLEERVAAAEDRAAKAEARLAAIEKLIGDGANLRSEPASSSAELKAATVAHEKSEYRIKHLLRYITELEDEKKKESALKVENGKLNYRVNHLLKYIEELEAKNKK